MGETKPEETKPEETKPEYKSGMSTRAFVFSIVYCLLIMVGSQIAEHWGDTGLVRATSFATQWPQGVLGPMNGSSFFLFPTVLAWFFIPLLITAVMPKKTKFTLQELTFIYAMVGPAALTIPMAKMPFYAVWQLFTNDVRRNFAAQIVPALMPGATSDEAKKVLLQAQFGGVPVPWSNWTTIIGLYILLYIVFYWFMLFGGALLKKMWVDYESLAFPFSKVIHEMILASHGEERPPLFKSPLILIGAAISFALGFLNNIQNFVPGVSYSGLLRLDLTAAISPPYALYFSYNPGLFGVALLLPSNVLFTTGILAHVIVDWIYPTWCASQGLIDLTWLSTRVTGERRMFWNGRLQYTTAGSWMDTGFHPFALGLLISCAIYPMFRNRRIIISSIKAAMAGGTEDRPLWIGWIGSGALSFVALLLFSIPVHFAFLSLITFAVAWLWMARVMAETGAVMGSLPECSYVWGRLVAQGSWDVTGGDTAAMRAFIYPYGLVNGLAHGQNQFGMAASEPMKWALDSYNLSEKTKTKWMNLLPGQLLIAAAAPVILIPMYIWLVYTYNGYVNHTIPTYMTKWDESLISKGSMAWPFDGGKPGLIAYPEVSVSYIVGFAVGVVLLVAKQYVGGPLNLLSVIGLGVYTQAPQYENWFIYMLAFIVQRIVYKIGGAPYYEKKVVPLAVGLILGLALLWLLTFFNLTLKGFGMI